MTLQNNASKISKNMLNWGKTLRTKKIYLLQQQIIEESLKILRKEHGLVNRNFILLFTFS